MTLSEEPAVGAAMERRGLPGPLIVEHPLHGLHDPGSGHVESPARYAAALRGVEKATTGWRLLRREARLDDPFPDYETEPVRLARTVNGVRNTFP